MSIYIYIYKVKNICIQRHCFQDSPCTSTLLHQAVSFWYPRNSPNSSQEKFSESFTRFGKTFARFFIGIPRNNLKFKKYAIIIKIHFSVSELCLVAQPKQKKNEYGVLKRRVLNLHRKSCVPFYTLKYISYLRHKKNN